MRILLPTLAATLLAGPALADDLLPAKTPIPDAIDHYIDARLAEGGITPAAQADDATVIRRTTLDLVGRIPTAAEAREYVASSDPRKREVLVDRLMGSPGFVRHQINEFGVLLSPEKPGGMREYLTRAVGEGRPWDRIFRELLDPDQTAEDQKGAGEFLRQRVADLDRMTNDVSVTFFGVNVSCAQCHDHPLVEDWTQDHFFGMKSFLARTFDNDGFLGEREYGKVSFKTTAGEDKTARLMFLTDTVIEDPKAGEEPSKDEQKAERELLDKLKKEKKPPPAPAFSARRQLVDLALLPAERDFFSRAIVNRMWARFLGRGLVEPLDQMHSANPPSHPELIAWLARDFVENGYDLARLTRGIVLSQTYSRSSRFDSMDTPPPDAFAVGEVRALTPAQLATSLRLAVADPEQFAAGVKPDDLEKRLESIENAARGFAGQIEQPGPRFEISVEESLLFSNSERFEKEFLTDGNDRLLGRLKSAEDTESPVDLLIWNAYGRPATGAEREALAGYLGARADRRHEAYRQVLWALLSGSEFRFNH